MAAKEVFKRRGKQSEAIRRMVVAAMLGAITAVMVFTPIGMIPLPPPLLAVTMVHIPVILSVLVESAAVGVAVGLVFGICSLIRAWGTGMVGLTLFFRNPLVSVLPRLLIPLVVWLVYALWRRHGGRMSAKVGAAIAAVVGSLTNTVCCLGMVLLLYGKELNGLLEGMIAAGSAEASYEGNAAAWLVAVVGLPNGIAEAVVAAVLVPILLAAVEAAYKRAGRRVIPKKEQSE